MRYALVAMLMFATPALAEEAKAPACGTGEEVEKILFEKGYVHLLDMKNDQTGVAEQLWSGGRDMVISAEKNGKICVVGTASDTTFNPKTIEKIYNVYKKTQKEL